MSNETSLRQVRRPMVAGLIQASRVKLPRSPGTKFQGKMTL